MIKKIMSIICMFLIISTSFVSAQSTDNLIPIFSSGIEETGESIIVNVDRIEPTIVPTNILEEQNVPVYVFLKGATLGSLALGEDSPSISPLLGIPEIQRVSITSRKSTNNLVSNAIHIKPKDRKYIVDESGRFFDMGYLILQLRKVSDERELPGFNDTIFSIDSEGASLSAGGGAVIDAEIGMDIRFDLESNFGGFGAQDLRLIENVNEDEWIDSSSKDSFWARNGYVRADRINDDNVAVSVYDGRLRRLRTFTLNKGEESSPIRLRDFGPVENSFFRIRLNDVTLPRNTAKVEINGDVYELAEGQRLYPGSNWKVERIKNDQVTEDKSAYYDEVIIVNGEGKRKSLRIVYFSKVSNEIDTTTEAYDTKTDAVSQDFLDKTEKISQELGLDPNHLISIMHFETGGRFDPAVVNPDSGAVGLIQFLPSTANSLGTSAEQLKRMSALNQLDFVKKYFDQYNEKIRGGSLEDSYMAVLYPAAIGKESDFVIFRKGERAYEQNSGLDLNKDNKVTIAEATSKVRGVGFIKEPTAEIVSLLDEEICEGVEVNEDNALEQTSTRLYCKSIQEIKESINKGLTGLQLSNAYYYLGQAYETLGEDNLFYKREALASYNSVTEGKFLGKALERKEELEKEISEKTNTANAKTYLEEENVNVILKDVKGVSLQGQPTVRLSINNEEKTLRAGDNLINGVDDLNREFNWAVDSITSRRITVKQIFITDLTIRGRTETINLDEVETLQTGKDESAVVQILSVDTKKQAYITILPGSGRGVSRSVVDIKIPIERRSIQFNTEQIDKQIENTRKIIKKLDEIIDKLDKIVKMWRAICLGVFAFLTLKNLGNTEALEAKNLILRGVDGKSGFGQYCRENSGAGKTYSNYDECVIKNQNYIEKRAKEEESNIKGANNYVKTSYQSEYSNYRFSNQDEILISAGDVRELELLKLQIEDSESSIKNLNTNSVEYRMESDYSRNLKERYKIKKNSVEGEKANVLSAQKFSNKVASSNQVEERVKREAFEVKLNELSNLGETQITIQELDAKPITFVNGNAVDPESGKIISIDEIRGRDYISVLDGKIRAETDSAKKKKLQDLKGKIEKEPNKIVITEDGKTIYRSNGNYYYSTTENYYGERIRKTYARAGVAEYYDNGRPFCVPTGNGNYARVLEYFEDGTPKTVDERNVGPNGILCDSDDVIIKSDSIVKLDTRKEQELKQAVNRAGFCRPGDYKTANFRCSHARSKALNTINELHCTDVMSISDCKILFNVCDPVMCPTSRFNLGGKWKVDNVPETGIIGSLVLGMPNSAVAGGTNVIPPVCLPGVQAGLEGIRSVFQGYEECLQTSKATGENVGICDKVKSVFICENVWREAVSLTGTIGALNVIKGRFFENNEGGGEYAPNQFNKKFEQVADSARFFLSEYSTASLSAYEARSLGQVGTEICKNIYAGKAPGIGKLIDQVIAPESPPQFTAFFDEYPWTSTAGDTRLNVAEGILSNVDEQSRYSVFYHIYAGRATDIRYSVYLKDNLRNVAYVTERAGGRGRGFVPKGDFVSKNIDFVGRSGYSEICVEINGRETCGFGRASTSLGIQYITDKAIQNELTKKINTKEQCLPEDNSGPLIGGPTSFGDATGGIVRVCSTSNPGEGGLEGRWEVVGGCGEDDEGINLGSCWIDTTTIRLNNKQNIDENVRNIAQKYDEEEGGLVTDLSKVDFARLFTNKDTLFIEYVPPTTLNVIGDWNSIARNIIGDEDDGEGLRYISAKSIDFGALAQLRIGQAYLFLANEKAGIEDAEKREKEVVKDEIRETGEVTGLFYLCKTESPVYYCINKDEKCDGNDSIEKSDLTQEQCKNEKELRLSDPKSCSELDLSMNLAIWNNRDICHKRTKDVGACFRDSETTPNVLSFNECKLCNESPVQRAQCSVYNDEDECNKWDPCVFDCKWNNDRCVSVEQYNKAQELNEIQIVPQGPDLPTVPTGQTRFTLRYSDNLYSKPRLYIDYPGLEGYFINNGKFLNLKNFRVTNSDYPIIKGSNLFDYIIGYVGQDGKFNIAEGEENEVLLERMNVNPNIISLLFSEKKDGTFGLDKENILINEDKSAGEVTDGQTTLTVPTRPVTLNKEGEIALSKLVPDKDGILKYDPNPTVAVADALYYKYEDGWLWSSEKINWNVVQLDTEGENNAQEVLPQSHREFIGYLGTYNPPIEAVKDAVLVATVNKLDGPASDGTYSYTPIFESSADTTYYREDTSKSWEWSFDKVNWKTVASTLDTIDGSVLIQEQIDIINSLNFAQLTEQNSNQLQPIFSRGLNGRIIVIDPGHGGIDSGATYNDNGRIIKESNVVLEISKKLKEKFEKDGATVFMTRDSDGHMELFERRNFANSKNPNLFLSIHANDLEIGCSDGTETYVFCARNEDSLTDGFTNLVPLNQCTIKNEYYDESLKAAQEIQPLIVSYIGTRNRGISAADFGVLQDGLDRNKKIEAPAMLIETGYLCNAGDRAKLLDVGIHEKIALSIVEGANQFFA